MELDELVRTSAAVAATRSRLAKREALATTLRAAAPEEIGLVVTYLSGSVRQRRTGLGWVTLSGLPPPADAPMLSVTEVDDSLARVAALGGEGSAAARSAAAGELFGRATTAEQQFLRAIIGGELRQGASQAQVVDALAAAFGVPLAPVQRAVMLLGSAAAAAELLATAGREALDSVTLRVGTALFPMLAASAPDPVQAYDKLGGGSVLVDAKLDGIRLQIHRQDGVIRCWTRTLDDITVRLPEIVDQVAAFPGGDLILDGEVVALGSGGRPVAFQDVSARTASTGDEPGLPLQLFVFDLLHADGTDLLDEPLSVRLDWMDRVVPPDRLVPRRHSATAEEAAEAFASFVADGWEGAVVKKLTAPYAAGRRDPGWIKVKPRHTLDLAVIAAEWGYGRRQGWLSNIHLAARGPDGEPVMLGKTFKGMTDAVLTWQTEQFLARESRRTRGTVHIDPPLVAEIAIDGLQRSTRYPGGVALRFARLVRYRDDKGPQDVDTLDTVLALAMSSPAADEEASDDKDN